MSELHILEQLLSRPLQNQVKIEIDKREKQLSLAMPIFLPAGELPLAVKKHVEKLNKQSFKPHKTFIVVDEKGAVQLIQRIPFQGAFRSSLRTELFRFGRVARSYHRLLMDLALEELFEPYGAFPPSRPL